VALFALATAPLTWLPSTVQLGQRELAVIAVVAVVADVAVPALLA